MRITSPAFRHGEHIPRQYTRNGEDKSPPLQIEAVPANTKSLVLIMDDPDAPDGTFTHWIVFDIDPKTTGLAEGHAPESAREGTTDWGISEYGGPKPPSGDHRYFFKLYALNHKPYLPRGATRRQVEEELKGHVIEAAELMGRYAAAVPAPAF